MKKILAAMFFFAIGTLPALADPSTVRFECLLASAPKIEVQTSTSKMRVTEKSESCEGTYSSAVLGNQQVKFTIQCDEVLYVMDFKEKANSITLWKKSIRPTPGSTSYKCNKIN